MKRILPYLFCLLLIPLFPVVLFSAIIVSREYKNFDEDRD